MQIYADIVFGINFIMDMFIFWIVGKLSRKKLKPLRLILGGFSMALMYCLLIFLSALRVYYNILASIVILMIGVVITFKPEGVKEFIKLIALSHIAAFAVGGMGVAFFYFTNISQVVGNMVGFTVNNFSFKILLAATATFYIIIKLSLGWYKRNIIKKQVFYPIKIYYEQLNVALTVLLDTGNSLHDPISNAPVIVAEFDSIKNFLPDQVKVLFYEKKENDLSQIVGNVENTGFSGRIRMIPFASLGNQNGMLLGFRPDKVEILDNCNVVSTRNDVIVGIYNFSLSRDGAYQGLLNPELIDK